MNRLAILIRKINEGIYDLDQLGLSISEQTTLQTIGDMIRLSPQNLANKLSQQVDPWEWIVPPANPQDVSQT